MIENDFRSSDRVKEVNALLVLHASDDSCGGRPGTRLYVTSTFAFLFVVSWGFPH